LRPDYVHGWIANPKRFLPYTGMPVNIPFDKPVSQDLYAGSSEEQVDALTDLLMHFDTFAKKNLSLDAFLRQQPAQPAAAPQPQAQQPPPRQPQAQQPPPRQPQAQQPPPRQPQAQDSRRPGVALN